MTGSRGHALAVAPFRPRGSIGRDFRRRVIAWLPPAVHSAQNYETIVLEVGSVSQNLFSHTPRRVFFAESLSHCNQHSGPPFSARQGLSVWLIRSITSEGHSTDVCCAIACTVMSASYARVQKSPRSSWSGATHVRSQWRFPCVICGGGAMASAASVGGALIARVNTV